MSHFIYIRNLTEHVLEISLVFNSSVDHAIPDSIYVPGSKTGHLIDKNTSTYMTDSIVAKKKYKRLKLILESGQMMMIDRRVAKKLGNNIPGKIIIDDPGANITWECVFSNPTDDQKVFNQKGTLNKIYWIDYY